MLTMDGRTTTARALLVASVIFALLATAAAALSGNLWLLLLVGAMIPTSLYLLSLAKRSGTGDSS